MLYRKLTIVTAAILVCIVHAAAGDLPVRCLGIDQGLSNNVITAIYQDHRGFMWIGTYDGLNRFDGYNFKIFRNIIGDSTSLSTNSIIPIDGDTENNIWVGTQNGLNVFDPQTESFSHPRFLLHEAGTGQPLQGEIRTILCLQNGLTLVGTRSNGLMVFKDKDHPGMQIPLHSRDGSIWSYNVFAMAYDQVRKRVWLSVRGRGLYVFDAGNNEISLVSSDILQANALTTDERGNLWVGTTSDLVYYDVDTRIFSSGRLLVKSSVTSLCYDKAGVLWIGTDGAGVFEITPHSRMAIPFNSSRGIPLINSNSVYTVYCDRADRKWIGTLRGGINLVETSEPFFRHILFKGKDGNNKVDNFILSFCEDGLHNLYIGTDGAGLRYWDRARNDYKLYRNDPENPSSISSNFITNIIRDDQQDTWISTWFGAVNRLKKGSRLFERFTLFNPSTGTYEANVWLVYQDKLKNIWAGATNDGSLYLFNRKINKFELFDPSIVNLQSIAEDREGNLWGGNYTSLIRIDRMQKKHIVYPIGHIIRCIREDAKGRFWLGTQDGGLLLFNRLSGRYRQFTTSDGLPNNTILRILEDKAGSLWISTYNGLVRFDPNTYACNNFTQSDGLQSSQFSFNGSLSLSSGEFIFGGINGFNIFYPDSVTVPKDNTAVFLTGIKVDNKPLPMAGALTLPFDRSSLSLDFVALDYSAADKIKYAYMLQGWDKTWNYVDKGRTASYSRLQEGTYAFMVKICRSDGSWSEPAKLLGISILPPWYRTWWAYTLFAVAAAAMVIGYIKYTRRQERLKYEIELAHVKNEKDREMAEKKLSFFTNVSHEFRTPLSLIINPLKEKLDEAHDLSLSIAYRNARRMLSLVDQLLLFRKADSGEDVLKITEVHLQSLCDSVYQCFIQQAKIKDIQYRFIAPEAPILLFVDVEKIEIALFNLLSNAFKYTPDGGTISFEVREQGDDGIITVSDSGCGIAPADQVRIFEKFVRASDAVKQKTGFGIGLYLVRHFVEAHKGAIVFKSETGKGSSFTIQLKKGKGHFPAGVLSDTEANGNELLNELAAGGEEKFSDMPVTEPAVSGKTVSEVITEKHSILLVDDNRDIRNYLRLLFGERYILYMADDGAEGLALADEHLPDLIISDISMSGMDGLELCRKVKNSSRLGHIPMILLTAATDAAVRLKGIEGGADDYITKPFDKDLLVARVDAVLRNRNQLQQYFFDNITLRTSSVKVSAEYQEFLQRCIEVVESNLDTDDFNMKKFSMAIGMSHSRLYEKVKAISGQSLNAFMRSIRLRRAAVMMLTEDVNITQASTFVGMGDARYFREQFVKLFGMTPSEYIKKYRPAFNNTYNTIKIKGKE
jgi:signal transduction histidine kinase/ligand-binding sensor domain-containing protein/CheY-like chemotaxis protein/AraC-like DNA-binding protein